ncbi:hypothetical protein LSAT2_029072 [Lamellibrachia satsuma]|nr:hypothetical protein LSAT2_029072 [Lamellibrachia satsuma]
MFPVRGHSFLICDRLFWRIEHEIKVIESITSLTVYDDVVGKQCGESVKQLSNDWNVYDWKSLAKINFKPLKDIQLAKCIFMTKRCNKAVVRNEISYRSGLDVEGIILLKRSRNRNPLRLPSTRPIASAKIKDIHNLLKVRFDDQCRFTEHLGMYDALPTNTLDDGEDMLLAPECDCGDNDIGAHI